MLDFEPPFDRPPEPAESEADPESEAPVRKRRKRRSPPKSAAHEARIAEYGRLVAERGWIFSPPTPEQPISSLFDHLTVKQIVGLGNGQGRVALGA